MQKLRLYYVILEIINKLLGGNIYNDVSSFCNDSIIILSTTWCVTKLVFPILFLIIDNCVRNCNGLVKYCHANRIRKRNEVLLKYFTGVLTSVYHYLSIVVCLVLWVVIQSTIQFINTIFRLFKNERITNELNP